MNCVECDEVIAKKDKFIKCYACKCAAHIECVPMKRDKYNKLPADFKWYCHKEKKRNNVKEKLVEELDDGELESNYDFEETDNVGSMDDVNIELADAGSTKDMLRKILASQKCNSNKLDQLLKENQELKKTVRNYQRKTDELCERVDFLSGDINLLKQEKLQNHVMLLGVPMVKQEIVRDEVLKVIKKIGSLVTIGDISDAKRLAVGKANDNSYSTPPILVKLSTFEAKKDIMMKKKSYGGLKVKSVYDSVNNEREIYINNYLTQYNMNLLKDAKILITNYDYKFVWFGNNAVFAQKNENSRLSRILTNKEISKLKGSARSSHAKKSGNQL